MELLIRRLTKGLDLLPMPRDATMASVRIEEKSDRHQFAARLSSNFIHSVSDISYETDRPICFFQASDCTDSTRSPLGPRKFLLYNFNGMS